MLTENQELFIEKYVEGNKIKDIAKYIGVSESICYRYLKDDKIKSEVQKRSDEIKKQADAKLKCKLDIYISELEKLALTSDSEKIKSDNLQYLIDRVLGKPTNKTVDITGDKKDDKIKDIDSMLQVVENMENIK